MDEISSTEFRKRYATLTKPTLVTALGRVIGTWEPAGGRPMTSHEKALVNVFNSRPFRPVPKEK